MFQTKSFYIKIIFTNALIIVVISSSCFSQIQDFVINKNENPSKEYLFLGLTTDNFNGNLWIVDNDLTPVLHKKVNGRIYDFSLQPNGEFTYFLITVDSVSCFAMDSSGTITKQFITPDGYPVDIHELRVLEDGSYYIIGKEVINIDMSKYVENGDTNATLNSNTIHYMDSNNNETWRWSAFEHYDILDVDDHVNLTQPNIDWTHLNAIEIDTDGNLLLSTRNFDEITKINRQTGDIIWRLGGKKNQFLFINDSFKFLRQHDVRMRSNGNLMMFDNGHYQVPEYSSYVEYKLNEDSLTATLVRRYSRNKSVYAESRGSVQELPNGHTLISWGLNHNPFVTEFNAEDSIEFEIRMTSPMHQYRAYRFPWKTNYFSVNKDSLNFNTVKVGNSSTQKLWIKNTRHDSIIINEFYLKDSAFTVTNQLPIKILRNDSVKIGVRFKPYGSGYFHDKLNIRYVDSTLLLGKQVNLYGAGNEIISDVDNQSTVIKFSLSQNYPNPFNPTTKIKYTIPVEGISHKSKTVSVRLKVYDVLGNEIASLVNAKQPAGSYKVNFDGSDLPSGIYFYRLKAGNYSKTEKMVLLK